MITVIGSLNMDLVIEAPSLPAPGETVLARHFRKTPGGKGGNQACAAARMGASVTMIGAVGDDAFGRELRASLQHDAVDAAGVSVEPETPTGIAFIVVDPAGENQIVVAGGANAMLDARQVAQAEPVIRKSRLLVAQLEVPLPAVEEAFKRARAAGVTTLLNPAPATALQPEFLQLCDWIIANELEARRLGGIPKNQKLDPATAAQAIQKHSPSTQVVITLGSRGAWMQAKDESFHVDTFTMEPVDTVGAGDTFVGAFAAALVEGVSVKQAARFAAAAAAISVTRPGAQASMPRRAEVISLMERRA